VTVTIEPVPLKALPVGSQFEVLRSSLYSTWYDAPFAASQLNLNWLPVRVVEANCGGRVTTTVKVWVALRLGVPLSVTMTLMELVAGAAGGLHENPPLPEL